MLLSIKEVINDQFAVAVPASCPWKTNYAVVVFTNNHAVYEGKTYSFLPKSSFMRGYFVRGTLDSSIAMEDYGRYS